LYGNVYAERTVWYVHPDSALNTIQAGLDSCANNDIVLVGSGTYFENLIWPSTQGIHMISELGPAMTIIDGDSAGRVITIAHNIDSTTIIRGFTIQNGWDSLYGGGIYCDSSSPIIIGNIIKQNIAQYFLFGTSGGGIYCNTSAPIIRYNTVANNRASDGGGISCNSSSSPIIVGNTIIENTAAGYLTSYGGGISCWYSSAIIDSNIISNNIATAPSDIYGDGIFCYSSQVTISNNLISNNSSEGIYCEYSPLATINGNSISNHDRYGIYIKGAGSAHLTHNIITGNGIYGSGIHCCSNSSPIIDSCTISNNVGDGIYCHSNANPTINYCNIFGNGSYGIRNLSAIWINAESNWWGHSSGPSGFGPGGGDSVSSYVDFDPWLSWPVGVEERPVVKPVETQETITATIFRGPLQLPEGKKCVIFDIMGRVVEPDKIQPGIYFVEVDGVVTQKVVKVR